MDNENNYNIKTVFHGMNLDNVNYQKDSSSVSYSLNAVTEGTTNDSSIMYQNESANIFCAQLPKGFKLVGQKNIIEDNVIMVMLTNPTTNESEIGKITNCKYSTYINNSCLGFSLSDPIHEISYKKTNCDTEIYWSSKLQPRRYVSISKIPYINDSPSKGLDCNKLLINPNFAIPIIEEISITSGGDNQAGTYQFTTQYANAIGEAYTSFYNVTNPVPLFDTKKETLDFNYIVDKTINLKLTNLDTTGYYDYINVAVIKTINNITSVELIGTYAITKDTMNVSYYGQKQSISLSLLDIFQRFPLYERADGVYNVQDVLAWYGMTTQERLNYQAIASQINLQWETYRLKADSPYSKELNCVDLKSYMRDEIYPIEICFQLTNGYETDAFTIPGRVATTNDLQFINGKPRWQVENTASALGYTQEYLTSTNQPSFEGLYQYGDFAYWESTELYPNNPLIYETLANQPIRHHKFPDSQITHIHDDSGYIYPIGIKIDVDQIKSLIQASSLTQEQKSQIVGFKILRGNRATHKSIIAKGIIRDVLQYSNYGAPIDTTNNFGGISGQSYVITQLQQLLQQSQLADTNSETRTFSSDPLVKATQRTQINIAYNGLYAPIQALINNPTTLIPPGILTTGSTPTNLPASYIVSLNDIKSKITIIRNQPIFGTSVSPSEQSALGNALQQISNIIDGYNIINGITNGTPVTSSTSANTDTNFFFPNYLFNDVKVVSGSDNYLNNIIKPAQNLRYTFHSPDTSFFQPALGSTLKVETLEYGESEGRMFQVKKHAGYKIFTDGLYGSAIIATAAIVGLSRWVVVGVSSGGTLVDGVAAMQTYQILVNVLEKCVPFVNYAYQFNAVGNYNSYIKKSHIRDIDISSYMTSSMQNVGDILNVNNWQRESSVFLKLKTELPTITDIIDTSKNFSDNINVTSKNPISSYYTSIKNIIPNQWGQLYSYETIDTGFHYLLSSSTKTIFGGDTFINKFSFKTKIPFFTDNAVGASDGFDIFYDELYNVGQPKYWYTAKTKAQAGGDGFLGSLTGTLFGTKAHQLYHDTSEILYRSGQMFLFAYGIPTFYCESSVNVDLRQAFNNREGDFFPHVGTSIPNDWLQESNVPIAQDNTYYYNKTFSKQNKEFSASHLPQDWDFNNCRTYFPYRTVFSEQARDLVNPSQRNNWLIYKPSSFFDFPQNYGRLTSLAGIENKQVLARFENKTLLYNVLLTAPTSAAQVYLGQSLFSQQVPPLDYSDTDTGYIGSQHKFLLKTEYGHISTDAKRGQVFLLQGQKATDLTTEGVSKFFTEYLNFSIQKQFPNINIDNTFNGIGLTGVFDQKFNRLILSKLDYQCLDPNLKNDDVGFYYETKEIIHTPVTTQQCNAGYTLVNNQCTKTVLTPATQIGSVSFVAENFIRDYNARYGTFIYDTYNLNGTSGPNYNPTYTVISGDGGLLPSLPLNPLWNDVTSPYTSGRMNKNAFWKQGNENYSATPVNFTFTFEVIEQKDYYIGLAVNNSAKIIVNCTTILDMNPLAIGNNHNMANGTQSTSTFVFWHIYKISLNKGINYVTISATNEFGGEGAIGFEIYDNTKEQLMTASTEADLNIVYSSEQLFGTTLQTVNYTCPDGCRNLIELNGEFYCPSVDTQTPSTVTTYVTSEKITKTYVPVTNTELFCNKSFTISYDFDNKAWVSFHSYFPNYYIADANMFYTGRNDIESIWKHNSTFTTYNTYYGKIEPYILEVPYQYKGQEQLLQSIIDYSTVLKYINYQEFTESDDDYFNKLIIYSNQQCSGVLNLTKKPLSNLKAYNEYPKYFSDSKEILYTKSDNLYKINTFWDLVKSPKKPIFLQSCTNLSVFKELNQANMEYSGRTYKKEPIRSMDIKIRYILDNKQDVNIQSKILTLSTMESKK